MFVHTNKCIHIYFRHKGHKKRFLIWYSFYSSLLGDFCLLNSSLVISDRALYLSRDVSHGVCTGTSCFQQYALTLI